jgi:putative lipoic acid-binding regulatory protein
MDTSDQYDKLREQLKLEKEWPVVYMFKFIVPADNKRIALVESKFSDEAEIFQKESSGGKYISITIKEVMMDAESIIAKYKEMKGIEGLIAL